MGDLHRDLVLRACRWLTKARRCPIVFAEFQSMKLNEFPDAIGYSFGFQHGGVTVVEVKVSIEDFKRDESKRWKSLGPGMGTRRFYLVPEGLISAADVPEDHGLIYALEPKLRVVKSAPARQTRDVESECAVLATALQRHQLGLRWLADQFRFETAHEHEARKEREKVHA